MLFKFTLKRRKTKKGDQLCSEIARLHSELQENLQFQTLRDLLEVYSVSSTQRSIEFFESIKDNRYKSLTSDMHQLLSRPDIRRLIQRPEDSPRPALKSLPLQPNRHSSFSVSSLVPEDKTAELIIHTGNSLSACTSLKLQEDLNSQKNLLKWKLDNRRKLKENATPRNSVGDGSEINFEETPKNTEKRRIFEFELEKIMEKFIEEKVKKSQEINEKYECQIQEIAHAGASGIVAKVIAQMKEAQQSELLELVKDIENRRSREIQGLRKEFGEMVE